MSLNWISWRWFPGITERVAKRIVDYRTEKGKFGQRAQLREVAGINDRIYEQSVGFLRVTGGDNPLDCTGIHPKQYPVAEKILAATGVSAAEVLEKPEVLDSVDLESYKAMNTPWNCSRQWRASCGRAYGSRAERSRRRRRPSRCARSKNSRSA